MKARRFVIRILCLLGLWLGVGLQVQAQTDTVTYVYTDPQGTPLVEADASGNVIARYDYTPYGNAVASLGNPPDGPGYTGHVNDPETGLVYMQARYYQPIGRFLSPDPVGAAPDNLNSFNRYAYADNNPIVHDDPTGMFAQGLSGSQIECEVYGGSGSGCGTASVTVVRAFNSAGKAYYVYADGGVEIKSGNRPSRDNNPGDLRHGSGSSVSAKSAVGWDYTKTSSDDKYTSKNPFAMFPSPEAGYSALEGTLKSVYGNRPLSAIVPIFAPAADHNNPLAYLSYITNDSGLGNARTLLSLSENEMNGLVHAIGSMEGMRNTQSTLYNFGRGPFSNP